MMQAGSPALNMPLRSHEEARAFSLAEAHRRLSVGMRVIRMDGLTGTLRAIRPDVQVEVVTDDNRVIVEPAGYWHRSAL